MKENIVCIEWDDASFNSGYYDKKDNSRFEPIKTKTAGFVVKSNRKYIIVSQDHFYNEKGEIEDERHITTIPRGVIRKIVKLKEE
jgi:hypothetical protein